VPKIRSNTQPVLDIQRQSLADGEHFCSLSNADLRALYDSFMTAQDWHAPSSNMIVRSNLDLCLANGQVILKAKVGVNHAKTMQSLVMGWIAKEQDSSSDGNNISPRWVFGSRQVRSEDLVPQVRDAMVKLQKLGLGFGSCLLIDATPCASSLVLMWAAWALGSVVAPVRSPYRGTFLKNIANLTNPKVFAYQVPEQLLDLPHSIAFVKIPKDLEQLSESLEDSVRTHCADLISESLLEIHAQPQKVAAGVDDPAFMVMSSGSTGQPKVVQLSQRICLAIGDSFAKHIDLQSTDIAMTCIDLSTPGGMRWSAILPLSAGSSVVVPDLETHNHPISWGELIVREKVNHLSLVPSNLRSLLVGQRYVDASEWKTVRIIHSGSGMLDADTWARSTKLLGCRIVDNYGFNESGGALILPNIQRGESLSGVGGYPFDMLAQVVDDSDTPCVAGQEGWIRVYGERCLLRYLGDDPKIKDEFGWVKPGDRAVVNHEGAIKILGRGQDVIKNREGEIVYLAQIDAWLQAQKGINESVTFRIDAEPNGIDRVISFISCNVDFEAPFIQEPLLDGLADSLGTAARPHQILVLDSLPKLPNLKPDRACLKEYYQKHIKAMERVL
jgi:acyl-coenzyme A synthetase/AMP-(fatty) acid ligase